MAKINLTPKTTVNAQLLEAIENLNKRLETIDQKLTALEKKESKEERIKKIETLEKQKMFPYVSKYSLAWDKLLNASNDEFDRYICQSSHIYGNTSNILNKINRCYYIGDKRDVIDVILLDKVQFENFCINIVKYRRIPFVESLDSKEWIMFFAQDEISFKLSYRNTKKLDKAICDHLIKKPTLKEWRTLAWLPSGEFEKKLSSWKQEYPEYLINKEREALIEKAGGEMISKAQKKKIIQCFGNCSTCTRESCVLDENFK